MAIHLISDFTCSDDTLKSLFLEDAIFSGEFWEKFALDVTNSVSAGSGSSAQVVMGE